MSGNGGACATVEPRNRASLEVVRRVATAEDVSPFELPPLNDTIDGEALDSLIPMDESQTGALPTVTFHYAGHAVRVNADGVVTSATDDGPTPSPSDGWEHVSPIDANDDHHLAMRVVFALAERTGRDPAVVRGEFADVVDFDSLAKLNRPRTNGISRPGASVRFSTFGYDVRVDPDGSVSVGSTLQRLKRTGGNVLVVGSVPDALVDAASSRLLGERGRSHLFALLDRDVDLVSNRLASPDAAEATVVNHATTARSAATAAHVTGRETDRLPSITDVTGDFEALRTEIEAALSILEADTDEADIEREPAVRRLCLDSLRPLLESRDVDGVERFLAPICEAVKDSATLAHYVLPIDRETDAVEDLEALFDATVELRVDGTRTKQRWHLHDSEYTTEWFSLETAQ